MSQKFESMEAAVEAQKAKAAQVKEAKAALTDYFKENKLKKTEDYTEDPKHGKKVTRLESKVDKYSDELNDINEAIKKLKPGKEKSSEPKKLKYDYPPEIKTAEQKKKYRIEQRKLAKAGTTEGAKAKPAKASKEVAEVEAEETPKKAKSKTKVVKEAPVKTAKAKSKKKKEDTDEEDD